MGLSFRDCRVWLLSSRALWSREERRDGNGRDWYWGANQYFRSFARESRNVFIRQDEVRSISHFVILIRLFGILLPRLIVMPVFGDQLRARCIIKIRRYVGITPRHKKLNIIHPVVSPHPWVNAWMMLGGDVKAINISSETAFPCHHPSYSAQDRGEKKGFVIHFLKELLKNYQKCLGRSTWFSHKSKLACLAQIDYLLFISLAKHRTKPRLRVAKQVSRHSL